LKVLIKSPGRVNLIGEHTDYNGGYVLPCAISLYVNLEIIACKNFSEVKTDLGYSMRFNIKRDYIKSKNQWENYVLGVVNELKKIKKNLLNFTCNIKSSLPSGSGMSSSSALVCGLIKGLSLINKIKLNNAEIIDLSRIVEHKYIGVLGGIMDQFTILNAKKNSAILLNCQDFKNRYIRINLNDYKLLLLDSNVKHNLANTEYNTRVKECKKALEIINTELKKNYKNLSQISKEDLVKSRGKLPSFLYNRALFVLKENQRTLKSAYLIENRNLTDFGKLMYQSHEGLKNKYEVSCKELDFLVEKTKDYGEILGSRMMGGGFGGCTINLINSSLIDEFIKKIQPEYFSKFAKELNPIITNIGNGIQVQKL
tara:strand:- start:2344 stop:3450 length:1107 start_codon:yes stop_codon:yes gene_type:complete